MRLLNFWAAGYTYVGNDNNYYVAICNDDCGASDEIYPLVFGPTEYIIGSDECPF